MQLLINRLRQEYPQYIMPPERRRALMWLGGRCVKCGFNDLRAIQIDHVKGGGRQDRKTGGMAAFYRRVIADTTGAYQALCANCNWIKRYEKREALGRPPGIPLGRPRRINPTGLGQGGCATKVAV